ncbi:MAG: PHP domain-containing protein [Candidatus Diapherotrites archaeon]
MKLDLHLHSNYSPDALTKPETAVKTAKKLGIGIAVTDHGTTKAWPEFTEYGKKFDVPVILGEEIRVLDDEKKFCGELIGLFLTEEINSKHYLEVIDEIKSQKGIIVVPHPFDSFRHGFKFIKTEFKKIDLIEGFNARSQRNEFNEKAKEFAKEKGIPMTASSDSHTPEEIGNGLTKVNASTLEEAKKELLKGRTGLIENKKANLWHHFQTQLAKRKIMKGR